MFSLEKSQEELDVVMYFLKVSDFTPFKELCSESPCYWSFLSRDHTATC